MMFETFITYSDLCIRNSCVKNYVEIIKWNDLKKNVCVKLFVCFWKLRWKTKIVNFLNLLRNKMI